MTKFSEIKRRWKRDHDLEVRVGKIIDALEPLGFNGARRVMRVIAACNDAGYLKDLGAILAEPRSSDGR